MIVVVIFLWCNSVRDELNIILEILSFGLFFFWSVVLSYIGIYCYYYKGLIFERLLCVNFLMGSGLCKWMLIWVIFGDVLWKVMLFFDFLDNWVLLIFVYFFISMYCSCYKLMNVNSLRFWGVDVCWFCGMWILKWKK